MWRQDEFDEALDLGRELVYKLNTSHGDVVKVSRLEHGGVRLSMHAAAAFVELILGADEGRSLADQLQGPEGDSSPAGGI